MEETMEKVEEVKKVEKPVVAETADEYVRRAFPVKQGEVDVRYCSVGVNKYRINFYIDKTPDSFMHDLYIDRSHYVVVTKDKESWKHEIL